MFENNDYIKRLMCGDDNSLKGKSFEELCELEFVVEEFNDDNVSKMNESMPCLIMLNEDEGRFGGSFINAHILCLHEYMYMGGDKLRYMEIASEISKAIHQKMKLDEQILKFSSFICRPINDYFCAYIITFDESDDDELENNEPEIFRYYGERLFDDLRAVFEDDEIRDNLYIYGKSGSGLSFDELVKAGYVRVTPEFSADFAERNQYAAIHYEESLGISMDLNLFASCGDSDAEEVKDDLKKLSAGISEGVTALGDVVKRSSEAEDLSDEVFSVMMGFTLGASEDEIEKSAKQSRIKLRIFADTDILQLIPEFELKTGTQENGIAVDLTDAPYRLSFFNDDITEFGFHMRYTFGAEEASFNLTIRDDNSDPEIDSSRDFSEDSLEMLAAMFRMSSDLSAYLHENGIADEFAGMDVEKEGLLLYMEDGEIKYDLVSGEDRPDLPCTDMGKIEMGRPYADELNEAIGGAMDFFDENGLSLNRMIEAGENGDIYAIDALIKLYTEGDSIYDEELDECVFVDADIEKELYWNFKGAEFEMSSCMFNLGLYHAKGYGVERDFAKAAEWMSRADEEGDDEAYEFARKYSNMVKWLEKAEAGDPKAQGLVADEYMALGGSLRRCGGERDYAEALKWAELSQGKDDGEAYFVFGLAYTHGRGVEPDQLKASEYYLKGAEMGHSICTNNYGLNCMLGEGVPRNEVKGFEYFLKSAELGYETAMQNVAMAYENGQGTEQDLEKALEWYVKSLEIKYDDEVDFKVYRLRQFLDMQK